MVSAYRTPAPALRELAPPTYDALEQFDDMYAGYSAGADDYPPAYSDLPEMPSKKKPKKKCSLCKGKGHVEAVCPNQEIIAMGQSDGIVAESSAGALEEFADSPEEKAIISALRYDAIRCLCRYALAQGGSCPLVSAAQSSEVAWEIQYAPALGPLRDFLPLTGPSLALLENDTIRVNIAPANILAMHPALVPISAIWGMVKDALVSDEKRRVMQVPKEVWGQLVADARQKKFGLFKEMPAAVRETYQSLAYDPCKVMVYIKVGAAALDWHGQPPLSFYEWLKADLTACLVCATEQPDPALSVFRCLHTALRILMLAQVQLLALECERTGQHCQGLKRRRPPTDSHEPLRKVQKERDLVFPDEEPIVIHSRPTSDVL